MAKLNRHISSGNNCNKGTKCSTDILGAAYFVSLEYVPSTVRGVKVTTPSFVDYVYNDMCVFNNSDRVINILYKDFDGSSYDINLPVGEYYSHFNKNIINTNTLRVKALNGSTRNGNVDFYFNTGSIPITTTKPWTTTSSTSSTSRTFTTGTSSTTSSTSTTSNIAPILSVQSGWDPNNPNQAVLVYIPAGYKAENQNKKYPWAIYLHDENSSGSGLAGMNILYKTGVPKFLKAGDRPSEYIIISPQINAQVWSLSQVESARLWTIANLNVDINRLTTIGTSIGGSAAADYARANPNKVACFIQTPGFIVADPSIDIPIGGIRPVDVQGFFFGGVQDSVVPPLSADGYLDKANDLAPKPLYPFLIEQVWGKNHTNSTWDDGVYSRKYRTDAVGTSRFDWIEDFGKKYKTGDALFNATRKVEVAETTIDYNDYLQALRLVKKLPIGIDRVTLDIRLGIVLNNIRVQRRIFLLSFGSTPAINGRYNNIASPIPGSVSAPFLDTDGIASPYTFTPIVTNWTTTTSVPVQLKNEYFGFDSSFHETAFNLYNANNKWRLSNLKANKLYNIRFYFADTIKTTVNRGGGTITINNIPQIADVQSYNTHRYVEFKNLITNSGVLDITLSSLVNSSSLYITGIMIEEQLNSNVYIPPTTTSSTTSTSSTTTVGAFNFYADTGDQSLESLELINSFE